jgi:WS/DGAT/MGAT family acyltransferase
MAKPSYQRLTQIDNSFLIYESDRASMHVASTQVHEAAPLRRRDGSIDIERIQEYVLSRLDRIPRYRQRLSHTPLEGHPVWIDDPTFNITYHVRHSRLPRPGNERQLKRTVGRIFSQQLDRGKPLWEMWVIEGLEGDRIAIMSKVHHCMVDGVSGAELISELLTSEPQEKIDSPAVWHPKPAPSRFALGSDEVRRAMSAPARLGSAIAELARDDHNARHDLAERLSATRRLLADSAGSTPVPFNRPVGPYRRVDWMPMSIDRIRAVRKSVGGTVNDVVLATASGGMAHFLQRIRGLDLDGVNFRVMAPVSVRTDGERGSLGNRVSAWTVDLPLSERDPIACLARIREQTEELKTSKRALGADTLTQVTEWTGSGILSLGSRLMTLGTPFNSVITNVPGPRVRLHMLESRLLAIHPHVPLMGTMGLGIALFSYDGNLSWGFSADWDLVPDLHDLVMSTGRAFEKLCEGAGIPTLA